MARNIAHRLAEFCIEQNAAFNREAWLASDEFDPQLVAFAASYLSMTSWYGYTDELERLAGDAMRSSLSFDREFSEAGFDLVCFSMRVRLGLVQRQVSASNR